MGGGSPPGPAWVLRDIMVQWPRQWAGNSRLIMAFSDQPCCVQSEAPASSGPRPGLVSCMVEEAATSRQAINTFLSLGFLICETQESLISSLPASQDHCKAKMHIKNFRNMYSIKQIGCSWWYYYYQGNNNSWDPNPGFLTLVPACIYSQTTNSLLLSMNSQQSSNSMQCGFTTDTPTRVLQACQSTGLVQKGPQASTSWGHSVHS